MSTKNLTLLSPICRVIDVSDIREDKNGREYRLLRLQGLTLTKEVHGGIEVTVKAPGRKVSMTQYKESYLDNNPDAFWDSKVGDHVAVEIYAAQNLESYEIVNQDTGESRDVTSYTFPVIRGQNPLNVLKNAGHSFEGQGEIVLEETDFERPEIIQD